MEHTGYNEIHKYDYIYGNVPSYGQTDKSEPRFKIALNIANSITGCKTVFDAGAGSGGFYFHVKKDFNVFGIEPSKVAIEKYLKYEQNIKCKFIQDIQKDYPPDISDLVVCLEVLEHIPDNDIPLVYENLLHIGRKYFIFSIAAHEDVIEGHDLHVNLKGYEEWESQLRQYFNIIKVFPIHSDRSRVYFLEKPNSSFESLLFDETKFAELMNSHNKKPFFSIIIPTYNHAWCLPGALESVLKQSFADWEVIVVNDGSTDGSQDILSEYAIKDKRIKGFTKDNGGVSSALNYGIRNSTGQWICWLSSDDLFEKNALAIFYEEIKKHPADKFFHSDYYLLDDNTGDKNIGELDRAKNMPAKEWQTISLLQGNIVHGISIAVHRQVFDTVGLFNEQYLNGQDIDMWIRISNKFNLNFINKRTCITRNHDETGTAIFPEAGEYDAARSAVDFINNNNLMQIFGFIDFNNVENIVAIIRNSINAILNTEAFMYQGVGFIPALLDRLHEWVSKLPGTFRNALKSDFVKISENIQKAKLPVELKQAFSLMVSTWDVPFAYKPYDAVVAIKENIIKQEKAGNTELAGKLKKYLEKVGLHDEKQIKPDGKEEAVNEEPVRKPRLVYPESRLAHKLLDGLKGIEIGPSTHNPFGLDTVNVGRHDAIYEKEQLELTGSYSKIHIEANADDIPVEPESYDFVLSSHVIEHCPDMIKALTEWYRITKKGGLIYFITPLRNAAPSDRDKPLTTWEHLFEDYFLQIKAEDEPEAGQFGHCHYHVFTIENMMEFVNKIFDDRVELVEKQKKDDKNGIGFTLVYKKIQSNSGSLPWVIQNGSDTVEIKLKGYPQPSEIIPPLFNETGKFVNIVMVTYNRLEFTKQSIDSILKHTQYPYVLTVVDNNSSDGTKEYLSGLKSEGKIKNLVLLEENVGVAKAANLGWFLEPDAEYFMKLDNDIVIQKDNWLSDMIDVIDSVKILGAVGYNFEPVSYKLVDYLGGHKIRPKKNGNLGGACILVPKRTVEKIGYWCEDYGLYGEEDADYCHRIKMALMTIAYMEDEDIGIHLPGGKAAVIDPKTLKATDKEEEDQFPEYRKWKDEKRRINVQAGSYEKNMKMYASGEKSFYCDSQFARNYLSQQESTEHIDYEVSIVIPVYNKAYLTKNCIERIIDITGNDIKYEIIVIDNASTDETPDYLRVVSSAHSNIRIIDNKENLGFSKACNQGIKASKADYILLLNNDTLPFPGWLGNMVAEIRQSPDIGAVGSCLLFPDSKLIQHVWVTIGNQNFQLAPYHSFRYYNVDEMPELAKSRDVSCVTAACMLLSRTAIEKTGLFDEEYINGFEDVDYCIRLGQAGFRLRYCAGSRLYHYESMTENRNSNDIENWKRLNKKWLGTVNWDESLKETLEANRLIDIKREQVLDTINRKKSESGIFIETKPQGEAVDFSIIIPVHNNLNYTRKCIEGIFKTKGNNRIEIIVIDNASEDDTQQYLQSLGSKIRYIRNETNVHYARVNNQGAKAAKGRYLLFLNNDTEPFPGWLEAFSEEFGRNSMTAAQGAKLLYEDGTVQHAGMVFGPGRNRPAVPYHAYITADADMPFVNRKRKVQFVTGAALAVRKEIFESIGGFDEEYIFGWEDTDLCMNINILGLDIIYNPDAVLYHYESLTKKLRDAAGEDMMNPDSSREISNRERYFAKWGSYVVKDADAFYAEDGLRLEDNRLVHLGNQALQDREQAAPKVKMRDAMIANENRERRYITGFSGQFHNRNYEAASNILIKCPAALGDSLTITAIASEIKKYYPNIKLYISGEGFIAGIFDNHPAIESFIPANSDELVFIETICDEIIDYNNIIALMPDYFNRISYMDIFGNIAGIRFVNRGIIYSVTDEENDWAIEQLDDFIGDKKAIALHLQTNKDAHRSYPYAKELIEELQKHNPGIVFINLGLEPIGINHRSLFDCAQKGITDIRRQIAIASLCDCFLAVDSAFFHIGHNLFNKPTMVITGITNPLLIGNPAAGFSFVRNENSTYLDSYWQKPGVNDSMSGLPPEKVASEFTDLCLNS